MSSCSEQNGFNFLGEPEKAKGETRDEPALQNRLNAIFDQFMEGPHVNDRQANS